MSTNDKDRATVVRWTWENSGDSPLQVAASAVNPVLTKLDEDTSRRLAKFYNGSPWRITITVERMPNEETT
jgi:hypothetical protein